MSKKKLLHFAENATFPNFFQPGYYDLMNGFPMKGNWRSDYFRNENPIVAELGCGKGEFTVGLARKYPDRNFIGIDLKGARMWRGAKTALDEVLTNVAFIRNHLELVEYFFAPEEVDEIWITFPDPQPSSTKTRKRLTSPRFLDRYRQIAKKNAIIHLKTDNTFFFEYTLGVIASQNLPLLYCSRDVYQDRDQEDAISVQTFYEKMFTDKGETIKYLKFMLH